VAVDFFPDNKAHHAVIHDMVSGKDDVIGSAHGFYRAHDFFAFTANGKSLVYSDSYIKDVNRFDLETRKEHNMILSPEANAGTAISADGRQIATVSPTGKVRIWTGTRKQISHEIALPIQKGKTWWSADFALTDRYLLITDIQGGRVYILRLTSQDPAPGAPADT